LGIFFASIVPTNIIPLILLLIARFPLLSSFYIVKHTIAKKDPEIVVFVKENLEHNVKSVIFAAIICELQNYKNSQEQARNRQIIHCSVLHDAPGYSPHLLHTHLQAAE